MSPVGFTYITKLLLQYASYLYFTTSLPFWSTIPKIANYYEKWYMKFPPYTNILYVLLMAILSL